MLKLFAPVYIMSIKGGSNKMTNIIEIKNLRKSYRDVEAVKGINFCVKEGSFFALLGENGAGKSTTINIISTLIKMTSGEVTVNKNRIDKHDSLIRKDIGVVFQGNMLDKFLTVKENIMQRGDMYGLSKKEIKNRIDYLSKKKYKNENLS